MAWWVKCSKWQRWKQRNDCVIQTGRAVTLNCHCDLLLAGLEINLHIQLNIN